MMQAVLSALGIIQFREVDRPQPKTDEVLIRVRRIGICGSDVHAFRGQHPNVVYPHIQGHEVSGTVAAVGSQVDGLVPGDKVVFMPQITCGQCYPCQHGMYHICENLKVIGFQENGAAQQYFAVKERLTLKLAESVSLDEAALIEPTAVAVHAISRAGNVRGKKIVVLGAGTIGNLVGQVALALGAQSVLLADISRFKLEKADQCGLPHGVNLTTNDLGPAILSAFGPDMADVVLECVGVEDTISKAITYARRGSTIVVVGVFCTKPVVDLGSLQRRELSLIGSLMYRRVDFEKAIELVTQRAIYVNELITQHFKFSEYLAAYRFLESAQGAVMKVMISLD